MKTRTCNWCGVEYEYQRKDSMFCSQKCGKAAWWKKIPKVTDLPRPCRECGKMFSVTPIQNQKWICSDDCRRRRNSRKVRDFHKRNPDAELMYRKRQRDKCGPDSNLKRFYHWNPNAPRKCESCGESRVLDSAHKPGFERNGRGRCKELNKWPECVWVLCPTCHALIDRMHYPPSELGLK